MSMGNVQSIFVRRILEANTKGLNQSIAQLASGSRINRSADDAAGLQISNVLQAQIRGSEQAQANIQDGINVLNLADGAMETMNTNLQRVRELTVQGANDTLGSAQRSAIRSEVTQLVNEIDRIASSTQFNGRGLFSNVANYRIQVGANRTSATNVLDLATNSGVGRLNASGLTLKAGANVTLGVSTTASALASLSKVDVAIQRLGNRRASIGALTNRLDAASNNLSITIENMSASDSRIRNTDVAKVSSRMTQQQLLQQSSSAMLMQVQNQGGMMMNLINNLR